MMLMVRAISGVVSLASAGFVAMAQVGPAPKGRVWVVYVVAAVLMAGVAMASLQNPRRSHKD